MRQHNGGDGSLGEGATPLMRASKVSDATLIRLLLDKGADPNLRLRNQTTALMIAASRAARNAGPEQNTIDAMSLLLARGADVNAVNDNGESALHIAVARGDALVRFLVEKGAKLDLKDKAGRTPLDVAMGVPGAAGGRGRGGRAGGPATPGPVRKHRGPAQGIDGGKRTMRVRGCKGATVRRCAPRTLASSHPRTFAPRTSHLRTLAPFLSLSSHLPLATPRTPQVPLLLLVERVSGVWMAHATLTSVSGGACVGSALQASIGNRDIFAAQIQQSNASLTGTVSSQGKSDKLFLHRVRQRVHRHPEPVVVPGRTCGGVPLCRRHPIRPAAGRRSHHRTGRQRRSGDLDQHLECHDRRRHRAGVHLDAVGRVQVEPARPPAQ